MYTRTCDFMKKSVTISTTTGSNWQKQGRKQHLYTRHLWRTWVQTNEEEKSESKNTVIV